MGKKKPEKFPQSLKFNGERYYYVESYNSKKDAEARAKRQRKPTLTGSSNKSRVVRRSGKGKARRSSYGV